MAKYTRRKRRSKRLNWFIAIVIVILLGAFYLYVSNSFSETVKTDVTIYFMRGDHMAPVKRGISLQDSTSTIKQANRALEFLMQGPKASERIMGLFSEVPDNIAVLNMRQDGSILIINFNKGFLAYGGGSSRIQAAIAQIVYTMTEISPIRQVKFLIEGSGDELVIGGEGYVIDRPLSRQDINI